MFLSTLAAKEYQCHVRECIGPLMGRGDHWWTFDPSTPPADLAPEIERAYREYAPSWFERHRSPLSACETLRRSYGATETALALAILGRDVERARTILRAILDDPRTPTTRAGRIAAWAARFGVAPQ